MLLTLRRPHLSGKSICWAFLQNRHKEAFLSAVQRFALLATLRHYVTFKCFLNVSSTRLNDIVHINTSRFLKMSEDGSETKSYRKGREMKLFPSSLDNRSSTLFMKRFLFLVVSDIMKKRVLIPTSTFKDIIIDGLKCCIVTEDTEIGKKLSALLYAVSEAIEKHYLRDFFILVSTEEADNMDEVIEAYTLTFTYTDGGGLLLRSPSHEIAVSCENVNELRKEVIALLHRLDILMNALSPVPQNAFPYFKLTYYSSTPYTYEPVGFKSSPTIYHFKKMTFISKISVGNFSTKFESCSLCLESVFFGGTNEQYEQSVSTEKNELQTFKRITDETPTGRPKKDRLIKSKKRKYGGKAREKKSKKIIEDEDSTPKSRNLRISSLEAQMEARNDISQENSAEIFESMRASPLEGDSPNEPVKAVILSCEEALASTTDLQKSDFNSEYAGALPTVTELVNREPALKKGSNIRSPSSGISIIAESDMTRELFLRRSSNLGTSSNSEPKTKKMKISRSKVDYCKK
ncbi:HORMA domain family protein [Acanthocheilonema viteae]